MIIRTEEIDGRIWHIVEGDDDDEPEPPILRQPIPVAAPVAAPTKISDDAPEAVRAAAAALDASRTAYDAAVTAAKEASDAVREGEENYALLIAIDEVDSTATGDAIEEDLFKQKLHATALARAVPIRLARCEELRKTLDEVTSVAYRERVEVRKGYNTELEAELFAALDAYIIARTNYLRNAIAAADDEGKATGKHASYCEPIRFRPPPINSDASNMWAHSETSSLFDRIKARWRQFGFGDATGDRPPAGMGFNATINPLPFSEVPTK